MNDEQLRLKQLAENLLATINEVVPNSTADYAVEDARRALAELARTADAVKTGVVHTWTFLGHWNGDEIVVDYAVPGVVQDEREDDSGQYEQGLWAAAASGATYEEAMAGAVAEYEDADDEDGDREDLA